MVLDDEKTWRVRVFFHRGIAGQRERREGGKEREIVKGGVVAIERGG